MSETKVSHRVLDPKHANKNGIRGYVGQLVNHKPHIADEVKRFVLKYKPGACILCAVRPIQSRVMGRHRGATWPLYVSQTACLMEVINGRLGRVKTFWTT